MLRAFLHSERLPRVSDQPERASAGDEGSSWFYTIKVPRERPFVRPVCAVLAESFAHASLAW